ncbi:MAG TPA: CidA/LrgA family protein [Azospirillaceae bacterium]|nr:CidA/LrgA family protein [Azospirillaceae bacterium]
MVPAFAALLLCQLLGELAVRAAGLPLPGPVLGMALLLVLLLWRGGPWPGLESLAGGLLGALSLLFVPAGVGLMLHGERLATEGLAIGAAVVASTLLTLLVTALTYRLVARLAGGRPGREAP